MEQEGHSDGGHEDWGGGGRGLKTCDKMSAVLGGDLVLAAK